MAQKSRRSSDGPPKPVLRRLASKQLPPKLTLKNILPGGLCRRYQQHREKAAEAPNDTGHCYVVDAHKTVSWGGKPKSRVPTILRSSTLIAIFESPEQDRLLLPSELPGIHGIRLPPEALSSLAPREVRSLVGNSMHVAQVGCFVQYALATWSYLARSDSSTFAHLDD
jgi:hypothetical protein